MKETWRDIKGYEGIYQISDKKRLKALERIVVGGRYNCPRKLKEKILSTKTGNCGLSKNNVPKTFDIETLYQVTFNGFEPKGDYKKCIIEGEIISRRLFVQNIKGENKNKTSKFVGVHWSLNCNKWRANIQINKKDIHLGLFENEIDAKQIYDKAVKYEYLYTGIPKYFRKMLVDVSMN